MRVLKTVLGVTALTAVLVVPSLATAETILPPGNSAATQYTETFPTTGGNAVVNGGLGNKGGGNTKPPKQVLGAETTNTLEAHGSEGETIVQLAAEAAPASTKPGKGQAHHHSGNGGANANGNGGSSTGGAGANTGSGGQSGASLSERASGGESALGKILSQATLSSSGTMGVFLPLALILTLIWAIAYVWRRRNPSQAAS